MSTFGSQGPGAGQLAKPSSIAVAPDGDVVVAEEANVRIQKLKPTGQSVLSFGSYGTGPGQFGGTGDSSPLWTAVGADGSIYVADPANAEVNRFSPSGAYLGQWEIDQDWTGSSTFDRPRAIETDEAGDVFVANVSRIFRFSADGTPEADWTATDAQGRPAEIRDIAVRDGRVYVVTELDWSYATMAVYDVNGTFIERWSGADSSNLSAVHRIAADSAGNVYTVEWSRIRKFDSHGELLGHFTVCCTEYTPPPNWDECKPPDVYGDPLGNTVFDDVAVANDGTVYATDRMGHRVVRMEQKPDPDIQIGPKQMFVLPGQTGARYTGQYIVFDASRSKTPLGTAPDQFEWDLDGDGTFETDTGANSVAKTAYATAGERVMRVRVSEPGGTSAVQEEKFTLTESSLTVFPVAVATGRKTKLNGLGWTYLACSEVLKFEWDLNGDGIFEIDNGANPVLETEFKTPGKQRVSLRVTRPGGRVDVGGVVFDIAPGPPPGPVGVSINEGAQFTNSPRVTVNAIWPTPTLNLFLANDGGFRTATKFPVAAAIPWKLDSGGPERLPKTVYLRFGNLSNGAGFQDDIVLDETAPVVKRVIELGASASASAVHKRSLRIRAKDNVSGVNAMQVTLKRRRPGDWRRFASKVSLKAGAGDIWTRVRDRAGNVSRWKRAGV